MNKKQVFGAISALLLIFGLTMTGCKEEPKSDVPSLPSAAASVGSIPNYEGTIVTSEYDARQLLSSAINSFTNALEDVNDQVFSDVFSSKYGKNMMAYLTENADKKSVSFTLDPFSGTKTSSAYYGLGLKATVSGKSTGKFSTNMTLLEYYTKYSVNNLAKGDSRSSSSEIDKTFTVTKADAIAATSLSPYVVAGTVKIKDKSSSSSSLIEKGDGSATGSVIGDKWKTDSSSNSSVAFAVSISNTSTGKGAKFIFGSANKGKWKERATSWDGGNNISDIEVYDNDGNKKFTIRAYSEYDLNVTDSIEP